MAIGDTVDVSVDQHAQQENLRAVLTDQLSSVDLRSALDGEAGYRRELHAHLAEELGLSGWTIPEEFGGLGKSQVEACALHIELGRALYPGPFLSTSVAAGTLLATGHRESCERWLPRLADGSVAGTVAAADEIGRWSPGPDCVRADYGTGGWRLSGRRWYVVAAHAAGIVMVPAVTDSGLAMFLAETGSPGLETSRQLDLDLTRRISIITFEAAPAVLLTKDADAALARAEREFLIATAAEAAGGIGWCLDASLAFVRDQSQFERPAGSFEAVASFCVDMLADLENVAAAARYAAAATDVGAPDAQKAARVAALQAGECYRRAAEASIHLFGDIGFTQEHDAQLYYRRAWAAERLSGGPQAHRDALASRLRCPFTGNWAGTPRAPCNLPVAMCDMSRRLAAILAIVMSGFLLGGTASASGGTTIGPVQINPVGHPHLCWQATSNGAPVLLAACDPAVTAQQWSLTPDGVIMNGIGYCLEARRGVPLDIDFAGQCSGGRGQVWRYGGTSGHLSSLDTCAALGGPPASGTEVVGRSCPRGIRVPRWSIGYSAVTVAPGTGSSQAGGGFDASVTVADAASAQTAYGVTVAFGLPRGVAATGFQVAGGASGFRCDLRLVTCTGTLPAGASGRLEISGNRPPGAQPGTSYTLTARAVVAGTSQLPGTARTTASIRVSVRAAPPSAAGGPGLSPRLVLLAGIVAVLLVCGGLLVGLTLRRSLPRLARPDVAVPHPPGQPHPENDRRARPGVRANLNVGVPHHQGVNIDEDARPGH